MKTQLHILASSYFLWEYVPEPFYYNDANKLKLHHDKMVSQQVGYNAYKQWSAQGMLNSGLYSLFKSQLQEDHKTFFTWRFYISNN